MMAEKIAEDVAILDAARVVLTRLGYERVGVREIAGMVGVSASLVNRYFGSKEALFCAAMHQAFDISPLLTGDRSSFGLHVARYIVTKKVDRTRFDPMLAMLRSAPSAEGGAILRTAVEEQVSKPLADWLGDPAPAARAEVIISLLAGFDLMRNLVGIGFSSADGDEDLIRVFAAALQAVVDG
jgi:AcrR family transcriptional regulator